LDAGANNGLNDWVLAIGNNDDELYVGGQFTLAGGISANSIAKWDGTHWSSLGSGIGGSSYTPNVTNFSKGKTIEGKTIKKFSNCLSLF
jgi:hypothetical protein